MTTTTPSSTATPVDEREIERRLGLLTLEQKVRLMTGADFWSLYPEPAVGLRRLVVSDGPAGVRGETWDERDPSANVPSPTSLAATWDPERVERIGGFLAAEARAKGVDVVLAPTVNLHRTPYGGRHFECLSEDPVLSAVIGTAYVRGLQAGGVGVTVKHFVANDSETDRMSVDVRVDARTLRELYLAPFEAILLDAGAWGLMAAYNRVNGTTMTENALVRDVVHGEWGFDGLTMSDWFATRSTAAAANAGLDSAMPGPDGPWGDALVAAVRAGEVAEQRVDDHVRRLLRLAARVGALDGLPAAPRPPARTPESAAAELRAAAAAGFVLVRNQDILPLDGPALRSVAVIGPNAEVGRTLGGGSATVMPAHVVSPLAGLREALPGAEVRFAQGVRAHARTSPARTAFTRRPDGTPGIEVRYLDAAGAVLLAEARSGGSFNWMGGLPVPEAAAVELTGSIVADESGTWEVGTSGMGPVRVEVGGRVVAEATLVLGPGADIVEALMAPPQAIAAVELEAGVAVPFRVLHQAGAGLASMGFPVGPIMQLNIERRPAPDDVEIERAAALAAASDVAVVVVGTNEEVESEGLDRTTLALPGRQDELVRRVVAANPRTVVVVNTGSPVLLPWADEAAAVLLAWFPGQEFGGALADALLGIVEPGGRLPTTWPLDESALPSPWPVDGRIEYTEGPRIGYMDPARTARFAFGAGLGYTTWAYDALEVVGPDSGGDVIMEVTVRNGGARAGREVVQAYVSRPGSAIVRPVRRLAGFAGVVAAPGEERRVRIVLPRRAFQHWDTAAGAWSVEVGTFLLEVGRSSAELGLTATVSVDG
jgi:beta-glucosidase